MHAIAEKNTKKDKKKPWRGKKERLTRQPLRAVEEGERDGGGVDNEVGKDRQSDDERGHPAFTQEHIAQMFEGELDEFASLTSCEVSRNQRQQQNLSGGGGSTRIQYLIENETSGDFFRVKSNNDSSTQRRKPLLFTSSMGASASRFSASLHFGKLEAAGSASSTWGSTGRCGSGLLLRDLEAALVVMCQGILAGLCWMDAFNLSSSDGVIRKDTRDVFACTYSASTVSLLGLVKKLNRRFQATEEEDAMSSETSAGHEAHIKTLSTRLLIGALVFTLAALLALLIAAPATIRLSHAYQNDSNWCSGNAEKSVMFHQSVSVLRTSAAFNAVLISGAWFCIALQCHIGYSTSASNRRILAELKRSYLHQEKRMEHLHGQQLERLSIDRLKDLIQTHQGSLTQQLIKAIKLKTDQNPKRDQEMITRGGLRMCAARLKPHAGSSMAVATTDAVAYARVLFSSDSSVRGFASLVSSEWLKESEASGKKLLIIDCEQPTAFQRAHISNAQPFALASSGLKDPNSTSVIGENYFAQVLNLLQVQEDATLVFYDDDFGLKSTRLWWVFHHFGFPKEQLKVLDGGWKQWVADANAVSTGAPQELKLDASALWKTVATPTGGALVDLAAVQKGLAEGSSQFIDSRTPAEYSGQNANGNARAGHVPGAVSFNWVNAVDYAKNGTFKSRGELEAVFTDLFGLKKDKEVITYCQRGIRAAHTAFVLSEVLEFENVKIYEDSMAQYLNRDDTAVEQ